MRVLIAPDKFRGAFTAAEVCAHLARGLRDAFPALEIDAAPMADGGEGTLDVILGALGGSRVSIRTQAPAGGTQVGHYGVTPDGLVVIESAVFCGYPTVARGSLDPLNATSHGLGEAIASALEAGGHRFLIGLGGTAVLDGGAGMALALGYRLLDDRGRNLRHDVADLGRLDRIDASMRHAGLPAARFVALCDVDNPLLGPRGAARVFGPQKGVEPGDMEVFERALRAMATAHQAASGRAGLASLPGAGSAGGLGSGCVGFLGATLEPGARYLMSLLGLGARIEAADLVITGEGSLDAQTLGGKTVASMLEEADRRGRAALVVAGRWDGTDPGILAGARVLTAADLPHHPAWLSASDLTELGRRIGSDLAAGGRLAKPFGR